MTERPQWSRTHRCSAAIGGSRRLAGLAARRHRLCHLRSSHDRTVMQGRRAPPIHGLDGLELRHGLKPNLINNTTHWLPLAVERWSWPPDSRRILGRARGSRLGQCAGRARRLFGTVYAPPRPMSPPSGWSPSLAERCCAAAAQHAGERRESVLSLPRCRCTTGG
jgi:hypothetical protein